MFLDRLDIDAHGPLRGTSWGPLSRQLNVIHAAAGSGKTALVRFLRDSLTGTTPACQGMADSSGRVVWAAADGLYHCHRHPDGSDQGRRLVEFEPWHCGEHTGNTRSAHVVIDLPAAVADGIVTDTTLTSVRHAVSSAIEAGLDQLTGDPAVATAQTRQRELDSLQAEMSRIRQQLRADDGQAQPDDARQLRQRLAELTLELQAIDARQAADQGLQATLRKRRESQQELARCLADVDSLRRQETDLRDRLETTQRSLAELVGQIRRDETLAAIASTATVRVEWFTSQLQALQDVTAGIALLRQTLQQTGDVAGPASGCGGRLDALCRSLDRHIGRLQAEQHHWLDQESHTQRLGGNIASESEQGLARLAPEPADRDPAWVDDELRRGRIDALRRSQRLRRIEEIADGCLPQVDGERSMLGMLRHLTTALHSVSSRLGGMRATLGVTAGDEMLDRWFTTADNQLLGPLAPHQTELNTAALDRCDQELSQCVDELQRCRKTLVHRVANAQRLSNELLETITSGQSSLGDAIESLDHAPATTPPPWDGHEPQTPAATWWLPDPLLSDDSLQRLNQRQQRETERQRLVAQRRQLADRLAETVRHMNDRLTHSEAIRATVQTPPAEPARGQDRTRRQIETEIAQLNHKLSIHPGQSALARRYRQCAARRDELQAMPKSNPPAPSPLAIAASRYLQQLSLGSMNTLRWTLYEGSPPRHRQCTVTVDSAAEETLSTRQRFLATLAVRLAASDELARRGRPLPLLVETPPGLPRQSSDATDAVDRHGWQGAEPWVGVLADVAQTGRQVLVLTHDHAIAESIARLGGRPFGVQLAAADSGQPLDEVNRQFDIQWRQTYGIDDVPVAASPRSIRRTAKVSPTPSDDGLDVIAFPIHRHKRSGDRGARSPFFLNSDSPIDHAPSIDPAMAARLQRIGIVTIGRLLQSPADELATRLGAEQVTVGVVRRWQSECRLVCGTRGLRPFDARVLVACGIVAPTEISQIEPADLVERVDAFLATNRGARMLRSGSRADVARLTQWIAKARRGAANQRPASVTMSSEHRQASNTPPDQGPLQFYLNRSSPLVNAPSIGPKMAQRLARLQILRVDDLLAADAEQVASELNLRRVDAAVVRAWQDQAKLVCRIPMLRGHDAQLLVAASITEPEQLAGYEPAKLLAQIEPIVHSGQGQRILRGSSEPDLEEVTGWIACAGQHRQLQAA